MCVRLIDSGLSCFRGSLLFSRLTCLDAKRAGKEWRAGVLKVAEPSGYLRRAMELQLTGADLAFFIRELLVHSPALLNGVRGHTAKSADLLHDELHSQDTSFDST